MGPQLQGRPHSIARVSECAGLLLAGQFKTCPTSALSATATLQIFNPPKTLEGDEPIQSGNPSFRQARRSYFQSFQSKTSKIFVLDFIESYLSAVKNNPFRVSASNESTVPLLACKRSSIHIKIVAYIRLNLIYPKVVMSGLQMAAAVPCVSSSRWICKRSAAILGVDMKVASQSKLMSSYHISSGRHFSRTFTYTPAKFNKVATKAMSETTEKGAASGLPIDLKGKRAFIAGIADDNGYGWAIAKSLAAAGAEILVGTWVPALNIFETSLRRGKFDESRVLPDGSLMNITKVYPLDAVYDNLAEVPEDVKANKRYAGASNWTVQEVAESVKRDFGSIDILVHSLANGPEVTKPLLETSRNGYLAAISASSYSFVSLLKHFVPIMNPGGASVSLTYIASERIIPGYGGGMSSAKAALESDTKVLAFEAGRRHKIRVNTISAGPLRSRAAKAIGFIDMMIDYSLANSPLQKELLADEVGNAAAFLVSPLASAITGTIIYVDNGLHAMGVGVDSPIFHDLNIPKGDPKS